MTCYRLLPLGQAGRFVAYVRDSRRDFRSLTASLDGLRLNKLVGSGAGGASLVSRVAVPAVIGAGIEYGGILRNTNAAVTTLRANALGLSNAVAGTSQFCFELNRAECDASARWLRRFSGSVAFEPGMAGTNAVPDSVPVSDLIGGEYRIFSWGFRVDLTSGNNLDDPRYLDGWNEEIRQLGSSPEATALTEAINDFFGSSGLDEVYIPWRRASYALLQGTTDFQEFKIRLVERLDSLVVLLREALGSDFDTQLRTLYRVHANYFAVRDELLRTLQSRKASLEYMNERHENERKVSVLRLIYSTQPTAAPVVLTLNVAGSWYSSSGLQPTTSPFRSVQIAGQLDRRLHALPDGRHVVLTLAAYYEWRNDVNGVSADTNGVGTGVTLPDEASTLLAPKGHHGIIQGKVTLPLGDTVRVPLSMTWASRSELVAEAEVRGQIGLTLDLDGLFQ